MGSTTADETEESGAAASATISAQEVLKEKMEFLRGARRQLSAEELASPIVSRFLIEEIERLDGEVRNLRKYRDNYHERDKEVSLLRQEKQHTQTMNLRDAAILAVGSAGIGGAPSYIEISPLGWVFFGLSLVLVALSFVKRTS